MTISKKKVLIIDLDISNVGSVFRAVKQFESNIIVSKESKDLVNCSHIILPGVGSFEHGMKSVNKNEYSNTLTNVIKKNGIPILGICLGMQLFGSFGFENNIKTNGLNVIEGDVIKFKINNKFKIPHMGWNRVNFTRDSSLNSGTKLNKDYYFVHSYHLKCKNESDILALSNHDINFVSAIQKDNIFGVQFHPEKSLNNGIDLLKNFLEICA